jgi:tRNA 2-selenouridine synthase
MNKGNKNINEFERKNSNDYRDIFLSGAPLIDLRAPCEFTQGAFPHAINVPLMNDKERELIGICYKEEGQQAAIELGHKTVSGEIKKQRVSDWKGFAESNINNGYLYCFRGGLRSRISQQWLADTGVQLPIIEGGYKAMRRFLIDETERLIESNSIYVVSGLTGSAKTELLKRQPNAIDLEGIANHRGSSFGKHVTPQPTQINFDNDLAIQLLKHEYKRNAFLLLEDEGRLIGVRHLPLSLKHKMGISPIIMIEESFDFRIENIFTDYVTKMVEEYQMAFNKNWLVKYKEYLFQSVERIQKRLGGAAFKEVLILIENAIELQFKYEDMSKHKDWIIYLLTKYYDPMYDYQMSKKTDRIVFKGDIAEVEGYINSL